MDAIPSSEIIKVIYVLLPGFVTAWIFYALTAYSRLSPFERTVQALIYTAIVQAVVLVFREFMFLFGTKCCFGEWTDNVAFVTSIIFAVLFGLLFSALANNNWLHALLQIADHNVPVCGSLGSECPLMIKIFYEDAAGADQEWLQGFYLRPDPNTPGNQPFCVACTVPYEHIRVPDVTWYTFDSESLIPLLSRDGNAPTIIQSITIYASGHSYRSAIAELDLIGQE